MGEMDPDVVLEGPSAASSMFVESDFDAASAGLVAEIITDEDFDRAMGENAKVAVSVTTAADDIDEEARTEEDSLVVRVVLRSLDVTLFVLEKVIAGVPDTIVATQRIAQRVAEVQRDGRGTQGWTPIKYSAEPKGRY